MLLCQQSQITYSLALARIRTAWGWSFTRAIASLQMWAAHGLACREPSAKSQTALRSCLLTAQRKVTALCLPDWRVDGAAPARQISAWGAGNRARQSPIPGGQPGGADGARAGQ